MAVLSTLGTEVDLVGTAGLPFALTVEFAGASPFTASAIDEVTLAVLRLDTGAVVPAQPSFSEASAGVWVAEWSAALTAAMGTGTWRVAVEATYAGAGPFPVCSGILRWSPRGTPGANTSTTLEVTANLAGNTVSVDVSLVVVEGASSLDELSDVQITGTPGAGSILRHDGTRFVNVAGTDHFDAAGAAAAAQAAAIAASQPLDADLTALAALTTTSYGRALLELANQAALMALLAAASDAAAGVVELATTTEATTGTDTARAVTPAGLKAAIDAAVAALVASAPGALDTLDELAAALGDDANFAATVTNALAGKQPLDADLTSIAALTTTSYGRDLLTLANQAALMALLSAASTGAAGIVELATTEETQTGTDADRAVTPAGGAATWVPKASFPEVIAIACSDMTTPIETGTTKAYWVAPWACTLVGVRATLATAGTGATTIDVNEGAGAGTSVLSTKVTIDSGETDSSDATPPVISDSAIAQYGRITIDFDAVGTGAAGVIVYLSVTRAL